MEPFVGESGASYAPDGEQREGGFATVWRCTGPAGQVAVKWTKAGPDSDRWYLRERGFLERLTAASDSARFVVPLLDVGWHDRRGFLVLPWIPKDLTDWTATGPDLTQRVDVARQVCDAVAGLHASGIGFKERLVHRDVKPHNLLVTVGSGAPRVWLADLGGAWGKSTHTRSHSGTHTPGWAPADQLLPYRAEADPSWDVYAAAATVVWLLTGEAPESCEVAETAFHSRAKVRLERAVASGDAEKAGAARARPIAEYVDLERLRPILGVSEVGAIRAALAPASADDLLEELKLALEPDPVDRSHTAKGLRDALRRAHREMGASGKARPATNVPPLPMAATLGPQREDVPATQFEPNLLAAPRLTREPPPPSRPAPPRAATLSRGAAPIVAEPAPAAVPRAETKGNGAAWVLGGVGVTAVLGLGGILLMAAIVVGVVAPLDGGASRLTAPAPPSTEARAQPPSSAQAGESYEVKGYRMIKIPGGSFDMGCTSGQGSACGPNEEPVHRVALTTSFWFGQSEVTQGLYRSVTGVNPSSNSICGDACPVEKVTWCDAVAFANALSEAEGLGAAYTVPSGFGVGMSSECEAAAGDVKWEHIADGYRLPTEAEWEYAARAGQDLPYSGSADVDSVAWFQGNSSRETHAVNGRAPNAWGLHDLSGNVWEWTGDRYWHDYPTGPVVDPPGPAVGQTRALRGGSFRGDTSLLHVANRHWEAPDVSRIDLGFRLARSVSGPVPAASGGKGASIATPKSLGGAEGTAPVAIRYSGVLEFTGIEVNCDNPPFRGRALLVDGMAVVPDVPQGQCTLIFKGREPTQPVPVAGNQTLTCTFETATTPTCL